MKVLTYFNLLWVRFNAMDHNQGEIPRKDTPYDKYNKIRRYHIG